MSSSTRLSASHKYCHGCMSWCNWVHHKGQVLSRRTTTIFFPSESFVSVCVSWGVFFFVCFFFFFWGGGGVQPLQDIQMCVFCTQIWKVCVCVGGGGVCVWLWECTYVYRLVSIVGFEIRGAKIKNRHKIENPIDFVHSSRPRQGKVEIKTGLELNSASEHWWTT